MLKSKLNYPYPMLRTESLDYKKSIISSKIEKRTTENSHILNVEITTNNEYINDLLSKGVAKKGILVKSNAVWYRKFFELNDKEEIILDAKDVYGNVDLLPCIVANERIDDFFSDDFTDAFKHVRITIEKGELIGVGKESNFDAILDSDIFKNTSSIFEFISTDQNVSSYDLEQDKIVIYIPKEIHQSYLSVANSTASPKSVLNSILVFPVLVSVLFDMKEIDEVDDEFLKSKKWYITIIKTIEIKKQNNCIQGLDSTGKIENPILVAQSLTNGLTLSSFIKLKDILEECE